jgi:hypothetical protein
MYESLALLPVSAFLLISQDADFCDACLVRHLRVPPEVLRGTVEILAQSRLYLRDRWYCSDCRGFGDVTRAVSNSAFAELRLRVVRRAAGRRPAA